MAFSIAINEKSVIELGETREELIADLKSDKIRYLVSFDEKGKDGIKSTFIDIPSMKIEVSLKNDIIDYIKSGSNEYNRVLDLTKYSGVVAINELKKELGRRFNFKPTSFKIESTNVKSIETILFAESTKGYVRIHVVPDLQKNLYISTLKYSKKA